MPMDSQKHFLQEIFSFRLISDTFGDKRSKTLMELFPHARRHVFHFRPHVKKLAAHLDAASRSLTYSLI